MDIQDLFFASLIRFLITEFTIPRLRIILRKQWLGHFPDPKIGINMRCGAHVILEKACPQIRLKRILIDKEMITGLDFHHFAPICISRSTGFSRLTPLIKASLSSTVPPVCTIPTSSIARRTHAAIFLKSFSWRSRIGCGT